MNVATNLLGHELVHFILTSLAALFFWWRFKDKRLILFAFFFGFFIDIDHWFDYFMCFGPVINLKFFFNVSSYVYQSGKVYVLLHGWEFVFIFWLLGSFLEKKFKIKGLSLTILFSYLFHLLWDNFSFTHHPLGYFFIYRILNSFSLKSFNGL
jgi:hypothetical protein